MLGTLFLSLLCFLMQTSLHSLSWPSSLAPHLSLMHAHSFLCLLLLESALSCALTLSHALALSHSFALSQAHPFLSPCARSLYCSSSLILALFFGVLSFSHALLSSHTLFFSHAVSHDPSQSLSFSCTHFLSLFLSLSHTHSAFLML